MNILNTKIASIHVDQIHLIPLGEPNTLEQVKISIRTPHNYFSLEVLIPVSETIFSSAVEACTEFSLGGRGDLIQLLKTNQLKWVAHTDSQPNPILSGMFDFKRQADGKYSAQVINESINSTITTLVIKKVELIQTIHKFGFHSNVLNPAFFGANDARFHNDLSNVDFEDLFNLVDLINEPKINLVEFKLISPSKFQISYKIGLRQPDSTGFVQVFAKVELGVDYENKLLQVDRIVEHNAKICCHDEDDEDHYTLTLEEFLENTGIEGELSETIDVEVMDKFITDLLTSPQVLNVLTQKILIQD